MSETVAVVERRVFIFLKSASSLYNKFTAFITHKHTPSDMECSSFQKHLYITTRQSIDIPIVYMFNSILRQIESSSFNENKSQKNAIVPSIFGRHHLNAFVMYILALIKQLFSFELQSID